MIDTTSLRHGCLVYFRPVFDEVMGGHTEVKGGHERSQEVTGGSKKQDTSLEYKKL